MKFTVISDLTVLL